MQNVRFSSCIFRQIFRYAKNLSEYGATAAELCTAGPPHKYNIYAGGLSCADKEDAPL